jgi:hypothetical protein
MIASGTRVYFATQPADLRKSFDGLASLARAEMDREPASMITSKAAIRDHPKTGHRAPSGTIHS